MERNACVDCKHFLNELGLDGVCGHPDLRRKDFDRVFGWRDEYPCCFQIRREQNTDACPHWDAKPRAPSVVAETDRAHSICEKRLQPVRKWWQFWR